MKTRFLSSVVILLALILPAWAGDAEQILDPLASPQTNEVVEQVLDPLVPVQVDEVASPIRDPFWPVGYGPGNETATVAVVVAEMTPEETVETKPVSQEEWDKARAKLPRSGGIFIGEDLISGKMVDKMVLASRTYCVGDHICQTNEFVAFTWRVDSISFKATKYELSPVKAERVVKETK